MKLKEINVSEERRGRVGTSSGGAGAWDPGVGDSNGETGVEKKVASDGEAYDPRSDDDDVVVGAVRREGGEGSEPPDGEIERAGVKRVEEETGVERSC